MDERAFWLGISMLVTEKIFVFPQRAGKMSGCRHIVLTTAVKHGRGAGVRTGLGTIACMLEAAVAAWYNVFPRRESPELGVL